MREKIERAIKLVKILAPEFESDQAEVRLHYKEDGSVYAEAWCSIIFYSSKEKPQPSEEVALDVLIKDIENDAKGKMKKLEELKKALKDVR